MKYKSLKFDEGIRYFLFLVKRVQIELASFSNAYMVEWVYGKLSVVRKETARILAEKIERGYYTEDLAVDIIRKIFYENPQNLYLNE